MIVQGMEELIKQAFLHVDVIGPHVQEGHYDLIGPDGEVILPSVWERVIEPDWQITMQMWPMDKAPLRSQPGPLGGGHGMGMGMGMGGGNGLPPGFGAGGPGGGMGGGIPGRPMFPGAPPASSRLPDAHGDRMAHHMFPGGQPARPPMGMPPGFGAGGGGGGGGGPIPPPPPPGWPGSGGGGGRHAAPPPRPAAIVVDVEPEVRQHKSKHSSSHSRKETKASVLGWMAGGKPVKSSSSKKYVLVRYPSGPSPNDDDERREKLTLVV